MMRAKFSEGGQIIRSTDIEGTEKKNWCQMVFTMKNKNKNRLFVQNVC